MSQFWEERLQCQWNSTVFHTLMVGFPHSTFDETFWFKMLINCVHNSASAQTGEHLRFISED